MGFITPTPEAPRQPDWPTAIRSRLPDGRFLGTDGSVWLYRAVPLGPVADAASPMDGLTAAEPIIAAIAELSAMTSYGMARRSAAQKNYRQIHMLLVNLPTLFTPPSDHPLGDYLDDQLGHKHVQFRVLMFGVRLRDKIGGQAGWRSAVDSVLETLVAGSTPMSDFDADFAKVDAALSRAGLRNATGQELAAADSWWNLGRFPDTPTLVHGDHLHVFSNDSAVRIAAQTDLENCGSWPSIPGQHSLSFAAVQDFDLGFTPATSPAAWWATRLVDNKAAAISVRGAVEPAKITRAQLRKNRKDYIDDINERMSQGKMDRAEQDEMLADLTQVEAEYASNAPPTLTDCSVVVGFSGRVGDMADLGRDVGMNINSMLYRQHAALAETQLCSPVRANPHLHDVPTQTIAHSGIVNIAQVGDKPIDSGKPAALLGLTEQDSQPAWLSPTAASRTDSTPLCMVVGATGSGKSVTVLHLADQFARMGDVSGVFIDPKTGSEFDAGIEASGGQVASLDNLTKADGVFDPIRFATTPQVGVELASSVLMQVNPFGDQKANMETPLIRALGFGVEHGATCTGQALQIAKQAGEAPTDMVKKVLDVAEYSPLFRAIVGVDPTTTALSVADGMTLIKVGSMHLELPDPGAPAHTQSQSQRVAATLIRMMVYGSAMALAGRGGGVLMLDEAWVFLGGDQARREVERLGRLARAQQVLPILMTQRVTDALNAGLTGYISRGLVLPQSDPAEAKASFEMFGLEPTPERMDRVLARATVGAADGTGAPNWRSLRHLTDPKTGATIRGAIAYYADLSERCVPVEVTIPTGYLDAISTNPDAIEARRKQLEAGN